MPSVTPTPTLQETAPAPVAAPVPAAAPQPQEKTWERSWTVEEMRRQSKDWNLAADAGMLLYLKQFSQRIISRTHDTGKLVDTLSHDAVMLDVRLHNTFNEFQMLANTQFIENRVYDEATDGPAPDAAATAAAAAERDKAKDADKERQGTQDTRATRG